MRIALALLLMFVATQTVAQDRPAFDFDKARAAAWDYLATKHAELGDDYKKAQVFSEARRQYDRARELVPDHSRAMRGLGFEKRRNEWVEVRPMPVKDSLPHAELMEARKKPDERRTREYARCADRCRKVMEDAIKAGDERGQRIAAIDVLFYAPEDEAAQAARSQVKDGNDYVPAFYKAWRDAGRENVAKATEGALAEGEDEQAKLIAASFTRRSSDYLLVRTSYDEARARAMHRSAEAGLARAMELLERKENPFGPGRKFNALHASAAHYEAMLTTVLKLEGDELAFARRLQGRSLANALEFMTRSLGPGADDMIVSNIAIRALVSSRGMGPPTPPWMQTGFSYMVTSQVLGTTSTVRYRIEQQGATASNHNVIPEFTKQSGTPAHLREVALYDITFKREPELAKILRMDTNDVDRSAAAKSFSMFEFLFSQHKDKTVKWLSTPNAEPADRAGELEKAFGLTLAELENAWREWALACY